MNRTNPLKTKSFDFALRMIKLNQYLRANKNEYVLSKQILRSGISIGAQIRESINGASKKDFIHKLVIALKEADETNYWLELLFKSEYIEERLFISLNNDCNELIKLLIASIKTAKQIAA